MINSMKKNISTLLSLILIPVLYLIIPIKLSAALYGWLSAPYYSLSTVGLLLGCFIWVASLYASTNWLLKKIGCGIKQEKINTTRGNNEMVN